MTKEQLQDFLAAHPDYQMCPDCGGAGERVFQVGGKIIDCQTCQGTGVVKKAEALNIAERKAEGVKFIESRYVD